MSPMTAVTPSAPSSELGTDIDAGGAMVAAATRSAADFGAPASSPAPSSASPPTS